MFVRKGIKVARTVGNEYAQAVCLSVVGGANIWVFNVYLPPAGNLHKRGVDEDVAKS